MKLDQETEDQESQIQSNIKKLLKLDTEKKKFASAKKFKDAAKCQNEIKETNES